MPARRPTPGRSSWKRFDSTAAVRGVSMQIKEGQLLGLIGPNGAGKTSLLKMIATLSKPDRGSIHIMGRDARLAVGPIRRRLGYMPAEFGKMPDMTVREYLSYFGAAAGVPRAERMRRIEDVLELVDLKGRRHSLVSAGSTGIKQRILIAKTLPDAGCAARGTCRTCGIPRLSDVAHKASSNALLQGCWLQARCLKCARSKYRRSDVTRYCVVEIRSTMREAQPSKNQ